MSTMAVPPIVRAVGYYITFFGGLAISSMSAGFIAAGWSLDQYPVWLKVALGAWPIWSSAFGLTAASHTPVREKVVQSRYEGYAPERALIEEEIADERDFQAQADTLPPPGHQFMTSSTDYPAPIEETNQAELTDPGRSIFFEDDPQPTRTVQNEDTLQPGDLDPDDVKRAQE